MLKNKPSNHRFFALLNLLLFTSFSFAQLQNTHVLNEPPDISKDFSDYRNTYYLADEIASFNSETGKGTIKYVRYNLATRQAFNNMLSKLVPAEANEFPTTEYAVSPELPFSIEFVSDRTIRIKTTSGPQFKKEEPSLMLVDGVAKSARNLWKYSKVSEGHKYTSSKGAVIPHIKLAQSTKDMDWSQMELKVYAADATEARGKIYLPNDSELHELVLENKGSSIILKNNPVDQKTKFKIN